MTDSPSATAPNGIKTVRVSVDNALNEARLEVHFFNLNYLAAIEAEYKLNQSLARQFFPISGGSRLRAGSAIGQVQVDSSPAPAPKAIDMPDTAKPVLFLIVKPIGDYSTYSLEVSSSIPGALLIPCLRRSVLNSARVVLIQTARRNGKLPRPRCPNPRSITWQRITALSAKR